HSYQHISYLQTESFGKVDCNGMVATHKKEAIVFDTPANEEASKELIQYFKSQQFHIKAIVATHFHSDCVAGLAAFHTQGIASYASYKTIAALKKEKPDFPAPQIGFDSSLRLKLGNKKVMVAYYGEGHTKDNVIGYFPADRIMFGGCLIKEIDASKGFLGDANTADWSQTVRILKAAYPNAKIIIPGHGEPGGLALLDYTIQLFEK
ncbi:MAG: subclass B1 metallo-beta-lactamase, partial [Chitinophagaceae bacterium]